MQRSDIILISAIIALMVLGIVRSYVAPQDSMMLYVITGIIGAIAGVSGTLVAPKIASRIRGK